MSLKEWKNKEIKSLLSEAWGFKMNLSKLNEGSDQSGDAAAAADIAGKASGYAADDDDDDEALEEGDTGASEGDDSKTHPDEEDYVTEDSGREEGEHYEDNAMNDEDHIKAIEHHLRALKRDKDYDEDHIDEGGAAARQGNEEKDIGRNRMHADRVHEELKNSFKELLAKKRSSKKNKPQSKRKRG